MDIEAEKKVRRAEDEDHSIKSQEDGYEGERDDGEKTDDCETEIEANKESKRVEEEGRDINDSESERYLIEWYNDMSVGDCVVHHGWLLHGSTSQIFKNGPRGAITFSYIYGDAHKLDSGEDCRSDDFMDEDKFLDSMMFRDWYYDVADGEVVDHPNLVLVWPPQTGGPNNTAGKKSTEL